MSLGSLLIALPIGVRAEQALVAVATNFVPTLEVLLPVFEASTQHEIRIAGGSTGKLYAQIVRGAPFDAFLAADQARPRRLEASGHAVPDSRITYAHGRLALWSGDAGLIGEDGAATLKGGHFRSLAIANPDTAPYGVAARHALKALGLLDRLEPHLVMGENVGQAFAFVATGNAEVGLVALSAALGPGASGNYWAVPRALHQPIRQDGVLLLRGESNRAARDLFAYLWSDKVQAKISAMGYDSRH